jgi:asparagine synthase (glutamine-hydrolysing)
MCGITGIFAFNLVGKFNKIHITAATGCLQKRGPDFQDVYIDEWVGLGHRRLAVIDTSEHAHQPMWDESRRYAIVFNGEIINYRELRKGLEDRGAVFRSHSDTEVLLQLFIREKEKCLAKLNGFFSFCIYDKQDQSFFLARDRYGIKPLLFLHDEDKFIFSSEMKSMLEYGIARTLDETSLLTFLQLNYIPAPNTIFREVKKLLPGHYMTLARRALSIHPWYQIPYDRSASSQNPISYDDAKNTLMSLLESAVQDRLVADVPLGAFLSGGIDSSIITGLARRHKPDLQTFSIGFRDERFFDETHYANLVAKHLDTRHTVFSLTNTDLFEHVHSVLNYLDEPFADSSAINVYILSRETRKHATVALSGDGADELLGGYNKHEALARMLHPGWKEKAVSALGPLWRSLPQSRNTRLSNLLRQANRFSEGAALDAKERYWHWAALASMDDAMRLLDTGTQERIERADFSARKENLLGILSGDYDMNDILFTDMRLVLPNDMLVKTDSMSMANGLEIRSPFLDYRLVDFAFTLPSQFKITGSERKRILRDAFRDMLPPALYNRPKKGFEVPLLRWLRTEMRSMITDDLLSRTRIEDEKIFNYIEVERLKKKLFSKNPGDSHARIWALVVFQWWHRKYGAVTG